MNCCYYIILLISIKLHSCFDELDGNNDDWDPKGQENIKTKDHDIVDLNKDIKEASQDNKWHQKPKLWNMNATRKKLNHEPHQDETLTENSVSIDGNYNANQRSIMIVNNNKKYEYQSNRTKGNNTEHLKNNILNVLAPNPPKRDLNDVETSTELTTIETTSLFTLSTEMSEKPTTVTELEDVYYYDDEITTASMHLGFTTTITKTSINIEESTTLTTTTTTTITSTQTQKSKTKLKRQETTTTSYYYYYEDEYEEAEEMPKTSTTSTITSSTTEEKDLGDESMKRSMPQKNPPQNHEEVDSNPFAVLTPSKSYSPVDVTKNQSQILNQ